MAGVNGKKIINAKKYSRQAIILLLLLFHHYAAAAHIKLSLFVFYLFIAGLYCIVRIYCIVQTETKRKEKKTEINVWRTSSECCDREY